MHRIGQIGPADTRIVDLGRQTLVGLEAHLAGDVIVLGGTTGGVHQHHAALAHVGGLERAGEQLVMGAVNGIAALEGDHVLAFRQGGAHLGRGLAGEDPLGQLQALNPAPQVKAPALAGDHAHGGMLERGGAVTAFGLFDLVGLPAALDRQHRQLLALVSEQQALTDLNRGVVGVEHDR